MKKALSIIFTAMLSMSASAQYDGLDTLYQMIKEKGEYEQRRVVTVEGASASTLYVRAMNALSDWKGPEGRSESSLDFHDKDAGIVTIKGGFYNGEMKIFAGSTSIYTAFILKVQCKDNRAQLTVTVPYMYYYIQGEKRVVNLLSALERQMSMTEKEKEKAKKKVAKDASMREAVELLLDAMTAVLKNGTDDDF